MSTAGKVRRYDTRPADGLRQAALIAAWLLLALVLATGRRAGLAVAEAAAWSLLLAGLALRMAGGSSRPLDERLGALLVGALGLSLLGAWAAVLPHGGLPLPFAPRHLPIPSGHGSTPLSTARALAAGGIVALLVRIGPTTRARQAGLGLVGLLATVSAADLGGIDLPLAPLAALPWLLTGWTCLVAFQRDVAPRPLDRRWRAMLLFAVALQGSLELVVLGLHPSADGFAQVAARLGPLFLVVRGTSRLARHAAMLWSGLLVLDAAHGLVLPGRDWEPAELGTVLAAGWVIRGLVPGPCAAVATASEVP
ncbi:MAG: hypothetical protein RL199_405 [Pseudomonadota bacterium]|jgi:hypothetical protein